MPKQLKSDSDFQRYMTFTQPINIFQYSNQIGSKVIIKSHDDLHVVSMDGTYYVKENCSFFSTR